MEATELMLAFEVHKVATARRDAVRGTILGANVAQSDKDQALAAFDTKYPLTGFVETAYRELTATVEQVKELRAADAAEAIDRMLSDDY